MNVDSALYDLEVDDCLLAKHSLPLNNDVGYFLLIAWAGTRDCCFVRFLKIGSVNVFYVISSYVSMQSRKLYGLESNFVRVRLKGMSEFNENG